MTVADKLSFSKNALSNYTRKIGSLIDQEVANEESFYPDFRDLLKNYFITDEFDVITVPKTETGEDKPDFIVYMDNIPIINIEAKNPNSPIDKWISVDSKNRLFKQIYRYRGREKGNIPLIITDFLNIWVIDKDSKNSLDSDHKVKYKFKIVDDSGSAWKAFANSKRNFETALTYACEDIAMSITKVSSMIPHLVKYAQKLKEKILEVFEEPANPMKAYLESVRTDFLESIFSSDKEKKSQEFADLIAQTLIYGGFIAWMRFCKKGNDSKDFTFNVAIKYFPYGTFTYEIFADITTKSSPDIQNNIIAKIERIFQSSQFEKITENTETLMITFYSDFLQQYDPQMAKDRGIVYTPHPIINFITRSVDYFLKKNFNELEGLTSSDVFFLDPAAGTMGFPCEIVRLSKEYFNKKYSKQPSRVINKFNEWVHNSFLKNTYAFEILMAPYVLGHLRINMLLEELGSIFDQSKDRVKLFLFNTLMELQTTLKDFRNPAIGKEIVEALKIRNKQQILVVLSNPPYNISSQNDFDWINKKINHEVKYFTRAEKKRIKDVVGKEEEIINIKKENNDYVWDLQREDTKEISGLKGIKDDYVKFIRFAQWKIKQNKFGIVAYITNGYYIDGIIFRGMRSSLKRDFDEIWIVDLHGDARKMIPLTVKEKGIKKDENIFGIKTGVAIAFFIRNQNHSDDKCEIKYTNKWGTKAEKFEFLSHSIDQIKFQDIPDRINFEFCPDEFTLREKYNRFIYLLDIFKKNITGIATGHDYEIMGYNRMDIEQKVKNLFDKYVMKAHSFPKKSKKLWKPRKILKTTLEESLKNITEIVWRGFDTRYISYTPPLIGRSRFELMQYVFPPNKDNMCLIINRQNRLSIASSFFISNKIFECKCCEGASGLASSMFPLKINESESPDNIHKPKLAKDSNINKVFKSCLSYENEITDKQIFYYIYAILYSPSYRKRYYLGLSEDYPRIPFPDSKKSFTEMSNIGNKLADFHLLRAKNLDTTQFPMSKSTDYKIYNIRSIDKDDKGNQIPDTYDPSTQRIYFKKRTKTQIQREQEGDKLDELTWIGGISQEMWDFEIGGKQQLKEWLNARRYSRELKMNHIQRGLNDEEIDYFLKICAVIKKTIELLPEIDKIYKKIDP